MNSLSRACGAETLKLKRTLALGLAFLAPLAIGFLLFVMYIEQGPPKNPEGHWISLIQNSHVMWSLLMLPLFITLQMGLLANVEHSNKTWQLLYAQPLPRWAVYAAKQGIGVVLIALSMVALVAVMFLVGWLLDVINPAFEFDQPFPWKTVVLATGVSFLASWLILAFHLWFSIRVPSFVAAMAIGIAGTVAAVLVIQSDKYGPYYPWTLAGTAALKALNGESFTAPLIVGIGGGLLFALFGCWEASRREVL